MWCASRLTAAVTCSVALACSSGPETTSATRSPAPADPVQAPAESGDPTAPTAPTTETAAAEPSTAAEPQRGAPPIGGDALAPPSRAAVEANREALRAHERGDFSGSLVGFERAITLSAGYAMARFNRACALSRLGRHEEAGRILEVLLAEDLPMFGARLRTDEDLEGLRASPVGARLRSLVPLIQSRYREAARVGLSVLRYAPTGWSLDGARAPTPFRNLRVGVYNLATRRFVPLTPPVGRALGGVVDGESGVAVVSRGSLYSGTCGIVFPRVTSTEVYDTRAAGERLFTSGRAPSAFAELDESVAIRQSASRESVAITFLDPALGEDDESYSWSGGQAQRVTRGAAHVEDSFLLQGTGAGRYYPHRVDGFRVRGPRLERGDLPPIEVSRGHRRPDTWLSPDGGRLLIVTLSAPCRDGEPSRARHVVDLVDLRAGTSTALVSGHGESVVDARFAADGSVFVQVGTTMTRYAPGTTTAAHDVPEGVFLATPISLSGTLPHCDC